MNFKVIIARLHDVQKLKAIKTKKAIFH